MIELWKTIIERVLSWPVAVVFIVVLMKRPLRKLIERISTIQFKGGGVELSASRTAASQLEASDKAPKPPLATTTPEQIELPLPEEVEKRQQLVKNYGGDNQLVLQQMHRIEDDLQTLHFPLNGEDTAKILIRHLAVTQMLQRAEFLYRLIFGSQMAAMKTLNEFGPISKSELDRLYKIAQEKFPEFYHDYKFDQWSGFLVERAAISMENDQYSITLFGREFLAFVANQGLPDKQY